MDFIVSLLMTESIAQSVIILAIAISLGVLLSKIKIFNISFGITWILFCGIALSHFGIKVNHQVLHFVKEFGLILFVYSIGLQVGPSFFSSFKKGGMTLNLLALAVVFLGAITTLTIYLFSGLPISTMVGIMSGAITNTPGLGAAQQAFYDSHGFSDPTISLGYAVAYPLGVLGIISSLIFLKIIFRIDIKKEEQSINLSVNEHPDRTVRMSVVIKNPAIFGQKVKDIKRLIDKNFVISRVLNNKEVRIVGANTVLNESDTVLVILNNCDKESIAAFLGEEINIDEKRWLIDDLKVAPRRVVVTKDSVHGKSLSDLKLGKAFAITVTRINRAGVDLVAQPDLKLQMGDRLTIVGTTESLDAASEHLGNSSHRLKEPNLASIFIGIALGIIIGSIPFFIPGIPQPVKLGLAGGPLIIAILISKFGIHFKMITYTTMSANLMLREIGISLFLACVGLDAGGEFVNTILYKGGAVWILYGVIITIVPLLITGFIARLYFKVDYLTLMGLIAGSTTDPPALAYANSVSESNRPSVSYATVYPLTMFMRVLLAQLLILFL